MYKSASNFLKSKISHNEIDIKRDRIEWEYSIPKNLINTYLNKRLIDGYVYSECRIGYVVNVNGFLTLCPFNEMYPSNKLEPYFDPIKNSFKFIIINIERTPVIVSRKKAIYYQCGEYVVNAFKSKKTVNGIVTNIFAYGIFVDIEGFYGLLHKNKIDERKLSINDFQIGQKIKVNIIYINRNKLRLGLALQ